MEITITLALRTPNHFDFSAFPRLDNLHSNSGLKDLSRIFMAGDFEAYLSYIKNNPKALSEHSIDQKVAERKMKLLALASMATKSVGKIVSMDEVASSLHESLGGVEYYIIEGIIHLNVAVHNRLIKAKIDKIKNTVSFKFSLLT